MKIVTRAVFQLHKSGMDLIEEDSYNYDGPISECKGGGSGGGSTTVQKADPWKGVQPNIKEIVGRAQDLSGTPMEMYPGQTYISRNPLENLAQASKLGYASSLTPQVSNMLGAQTSMLNAPDVASNPYVQGMGDVVERRLNRNLEENILPALGTQAVSRGQYGGTRQGVAEGIAARGTQEAYGDAMAQLQGQAYEKGLDQQARALTLAPQTLQTGLIPSAMMGDVGAYQRGEEELALQEGMARHAFEQQEPWERLRAYNEFVQGMPWSSTATTSGGSQRGGGGSSFGNILGGAMSGYGMMTSPMMTSALSGAGMGSWAGPIGIGIGALAGGLLS